MRVSATAGGAAGDSGSNAGSDRDARTPGPPPALPPRPPPGPRRAALTGLHRQRALWAAPPPDAAAAAGPDLGGTPCREPDSPSQGRPAAGPLGLDRPPAPARPRPKPPRDGDRAARAWAAPHACAGGAPGGRLPAGWTRSSHTLARGLPRQRRSRGPGPPPRAPRAPPPRRGVGASRPRPARSPYRSEDARTGFAPDPGPLPAPRRERPERNDDGRTRLSVVTPVS